MKGKLMPRRHKDAGRCTLTQPDTAHVCTVNLAWPRLDVGSNVFSKVPKKEFAQKITVEKLLFAFRLCQYQNPFA